jgi:hypothetical protein
MKKIIAYFQAAFISWLILRAQRAVTLPNLHGDGRSE